MKSELTGEKKDIDFNKEIFRYGTYQSNLNNKVRNRKSKDQGKKNPA